MIVIYFIFDFIIMNMLPINTYFIVIDLERNNKFSVISVGILLDLIYKRFLISTVILLCLFILLKLFKVNKKYRVIKNILLYVLFFIVGIYL